MINHETGDFAEVVTAGNLRCQTVAVNGDVRIVGIGMFRNDTTFAVFQNRNDQVHVISWRKANKREQKLYREHGHEWLDFNTAFHTKGAKR